MSVCVCVASFLYSDHVIARHDCVTVYKSRVVVVKLFHLESFTHQHLQVFVGPHLGGHCLQEKHSVLVVHLHQLRRKLQK